MRLEAAISRFEALREAEWRVPADLLAALRVKDDIHRLAAEVDGYLGLRLAFDTGDTDAIAHRPRMDALTARWDGEASAWFAPRVRGLGSDRIAAWVAELPALVPYRWALRRTASDRPLPAEGDSKLLAQIDAEREAARRVHAALNVAEAPRVVLDLAAGRRIEIGPALGRNLSAEIADAGDRRAARRAWLAALAGRAETNAALLEGVVRREAEASRARGYPSPLAASFADEGVPEPVVLDMLAAARRGAPVVARWHRARKRLLGLDRYGPCDIAAPLAGARQTLDWSTARADLMASVGPLGPEVLAVLARAFDERWIDAAERPRKQPLGFSTFVYRDRPFVSMVFRGTIADLVRLSHELGHAVHHRLAFESQPFGPSRPATLTGETVAAVHEALLARLLASRATTAAERAAALDLEAQLIHRSFIATALDADFELAAHGQSSGLSAARLAELYRQRLEAFHGGALDLEAGDGNGWLETPHFFSSPFTMARYGLSFAAAARIVEGLVSTDPAVAREARGRYLALLRAGGSAAPLDLLAVAGADLADPEALAAVPRRLAEIAAELERALGPEAP